MSRLVPLPSMEKQEDYDPWNWNADRPTQLIHLIDRTTKQEIPIPWHHHIAQETKLRLEMINAVNSQYVIEHQVWSKFQYLKYLEIVIVLIVQLEYLFIFIYPYEDLVITEALG